MKRTIALLLCVLTQPLHAENFLEQKIDAYIAQTQADASLKPHWDLLKQNNYIEHTGPDAEYRTRYVDLQGIIESALSDEENINVTAIIHTATPPTPLRAPDGEITPGLLSPEVAADPKLIATVTKRCNILRRFLANGKKLYAAYPISSLSAAIPVPGISTFNDLCSNFKNLINTPFEGGFAKSDLTGATYFIQIPGENEPIVFSIMALQANDAQPEAKWAMWYGPLSNAQVNARAEQIQTFLKEKKIALDLN
ncbi:MAG: hypothetical protein Q8K37_05590 [Alphaproteobacteria bacterium]|nr:hypothetical protein [Alphaproteobacteria bacterium]